MVGIELISMMMMCRGKKAEGVGCASRATMMSMTAGTDVRDEGDTDSKSTSEYDDEGEGGGVGSIWIAIRGLH